MVFLHVGVGDCSSWRWRSSCSGLIPTGCAADAPRGEGSVRPVLTTRGAALLTVCSQTVRILLDVAAHVRGKHAGQAHNGGRACTSWDRLVGFKSRHPDHNGAPPWSPSAREATRLGVDGEALRGHELAHLTQVEPAELPSMSEAMTEQLEIEMARRGLILLFQQVLDDGLDVGVAGRQRRAGEAGSLGRMLKTRSTVATFSMPDANPLTERWPLCRVATVAGSIVNPAAATAR